MNKKMLFGAVLIAIVVLAVIAIVYLHTDDDSSRAPDINAGLLSTGSFDLTDENTGTFANSSYFVTEINNKTMLTIVAEIHIDADDVGGVVFDLPPGIKVIDVLCNYRNDISTNCVTVWTTGDDLPYTTSVEVGRKFSGHPTGGGDGTILLQMHVADEINSNSIDVRVGLGSVKTEHGSIIAHPTSKVVTIPLKQ